MARLVARLTVLFLLFTVEVRIHASEPVWLAEPAKCTFNEKGCALQARAPKAELIWEDARVSAEKGSVLGWTDSQELQLVRGTVLVSLTEGKRIKLPNAVVTGDGEILIEKKGTATTVTCLIGQVALKALGITEALRVPAGFTQILDSVDAEGHSQTEIPMTAPLSASIKKWWGLFPGTKHEFLPLAKQFTKTVAANIEITSLWHADMVQRAIAAQEEADRIEAERQRKAAEESRKYRDLFRKLNYLGSELPD